MRRQGDITTLIDKKAASIPRSDLEEIPRKLENVSRVEVLFPELNRAHAGAARCLDGSLQCGS
jgi:hypothetical protein